MVKRMRGVKGDRVGGKKISGYNEVIVIDL